MGLRFYVSLCSRYPKVGASYEFLLTKNEILVIPDLRRPLKNSVFNPRGNLLQLASRELPDVRHFF